MVSIICKYISVLNKLLSSMYNDKLSTDNKCGLVDAHAYPYLEVEIIKTERRGELERIPDMRSRKTIKNLKEAESLAILT